MEVWCFSKKKTRSHDLTACSICKTCTQLIQLDCMLWAFGKYIANCKHLLYRLIKKSIFIYTMVSVENVHVLCSNLILSILAFGFLLRDPSTMHHWVNTILQCRWSNVWCNTPSLTRYCHSFGDACNWYETVSPVFMCNTVLLCPIDSYASIHACVVFHHTCFTRWNNNWMQQMCAEFRKVGVSAHAKRYGHV